MIRYGNFNAYYFPQSNQDLELKTVTPVNTFRLIFNNFFNGEYDYLDERVYTVDGKYSNFTDVTDVLSRN